MNKVVPIWSGRFSAHQKDEDKGDDTDSGLRVVPLPNIPKFMVLMGSV